ncbi:hypothetical protein EXIGLDRAFT_736128 [Exidia glandulosa HHB12029]|uniref:PH domain-containing protein n=1 Tax=Exidia glandulosa HHB12029 TaxID=1314781 RepID=A0A166NAP3_EXIGL|nr:hypothetical protein EXIGLDRAFT_736128 [Exidia glandulosa HHB12029]
MSSSESNVIRTGWATVKRNGLLAFLTWPRRFIVLGDKTLAIRKSESGAARGLVDLSDIAKVERLDNVSKPYCILLETKNSRRFCINLSSDTEVYDWMDDIYARSPLRQGDPTNFVHHQHATFDPNSGKFVGLPSEWGGSLNGQQQQAH